MLFYSRLRYSTSVHWFCNQVYVIGFRINQISWLRKDKEKAIGKHGLLGIWFDTREAAEWLMDRGLLVGHTHIGSVILY